MEATYKVHCGDALTVLTTIPSASVDCCVTSPPYFGLRDYGVSGQIGLEETPEQYVANLLNIFAEVRRVLRQDGTLWLNVGDTYATGSGGSGTNSRKQKSNQGANMAARKPQRSGNLKSKDLIGIPWMVAFALRDDGWYLRSETIWHKLNPMPESVTDRPTKAHEQVFLLAKNEKYYYDADAIREPCTTEPHAHGASKQRHQILAIRNAASDAASRQPDRIWAAQGGRNRRSVISLPVASYRGQHYATFPPKLIEPFILAGCPPGGTVLDPFSGAATTGLVALQNHRRYVGIELNPEYCRMGEDRLRDAVAAAAPSLVGAFENMSGCSDRMIWTPPSRTLMVPDGAADIDQNVNLLIHQSVGKRQVPSLLHLFV
jgi:DNA modification methylase